MGKRCVDLDCPYAAMDGSCLLSEDELKEKCRAIELEGYEDKDEWIHEGLAKEKLRSLGVLQ